MNIDFKRDILHLTPSAYMPGYFTTLIVFTNLTPHLLLFNFRLQCGVVYSLCDCGTKQQFFAESLIWVSWKLLLRVVEGTRWEEEWGGYFEWGVKDGYLVPRSQPNTWLLILPAKVGRKSLVESVLGRKWWYSVLYLCWAYTYKLN